MTSKLKSLLAASSLLLAVGCQSSTTVLDQDTPLRLAAPVDAYVFADVGPKATPTQPHVENWVRQAKKVTLATGKYVITRRSPSAATTP